MTQIIELGVFVSALALAISSAIVSHVRKMMTSPREAQAATQMMMMMVLVLVVLVVLLMLMLLMAHCFQYGFSSGSLLHPCFPCSPTLPHPLHTHVCLLLNLNNFCACKCFQWKNIFCSAKWRRGKSFILFGFISFWFLSPVLCLFAPLQIFIEFE